MKPMAIWPHDIDLRLRAASDPKKQVPPPRYVQVNLRPGRSVPAPAHGSTKPSFRG